MIITDENFDQAIKENATLLVEFWADWCGPCKMLAPVLDSVTKETGLLVGKINVDENLEKPAEYGVSSIPYMVLFRDGNPVHKIIGAMPKHKLLAELAQWI